MSAVLDAAPGGVTHHTAVPKSEGNGEWHQVQLMHGRRYVLAKLSKRRHDHLSFVEPTGRLTAQSQLDGGDFFFERRLCTNGREHSKHELRD